MPAPDIEMTTSQTHNPMDDEDLIDYDDDVLGDIEIPNDATSKPQETAHVEVEEEHPRIDEPHEDAGDQQATTQRHDDAEEVVGVTSVEPGNGESAGDGSPALGGEVLGSIDESTSKQATAVRLDDTDEIDFDIGDDASAGGQVPQETADQASNQEPADQATTLSTQTAQQLAENDEEAGEGNEPHGHPEKDVQEDEITWEEEDDVTGDGAPVGDAEAAQIEQHPDDTAQAVATAPETAADTAHDDVDGEQDDAEALGNERGFDDSAWPQITVQYKGEEFPLLSTQAEGFFTDSSVLDESIGGLLAGLRVELVDEISSDEELVFQIDELGLEFSESYPQESLSHYTLNQIMEIFDLLVKNQDPDSTRGLYTYLFTKPSTTKRFEWLVESAAAGKGLSEVTYHFESPLPDGAVHDYLDEGDNFLDPMEDYPSEQDTAKEAHAAQTEDGAMTATHDEDYELGGDFDDNHIEAATEEQVERGNEERVEATDDTAAVATHQETEVEVEVETGPNGVTETTTHAVTDVDATGSTTEVVTETETKADTESAAGAVLDEGRGDFPCVTTFLEEELEPLDADHDQSKHEEQYESTMEASAGTQDASGQLNMDDAAPDGADLDEIDWRDDDDVEVAEESHAPPTSPSAAKRARDEDELDLDDEQDSKRQRS